MAEKRVGSSTVLLQKNISIISTASIVGPMEGQGPFRKYFDEVLDDDKCGQSSYEKAESMMLRKAIDTAVNKSALNEVDIDIMLGGDLLNQIISASFAAREYVIPFLGLYGACSTMAESLLIGSLVLEAGAFDNAICTTSSHFSSAERQYRAPLELGNQRTPAAQHTVTGAGATVISTARQSRQCITGMTVGRVCDYGINDVNNMGAAMAPAAIDTLIQHFKDTGRAPDYYDMIVTGDLGKLGKEIVNEQMREAGYNIEDRYMDCGDEIFSLEQEMHCGGSGCGCAAVILNGYIAEQMRRGTFNKVLFMATGALLSPLSSQQGESIPGIAHAVAIENKG